MTSVVAELPQRAGEHTLMFAGPVGPIELKLAIPESSPAGIAVICHPHSLMGGSMDNKVVFTLHRAFRDAGWITVRFNFRGVGHSAGEFDAGLGEASDLLALLATCQQSFGALPLWLAGFSFGSFVALSAWPQVVGQGWTSSRLLMVAPPVQRFPLEGLMAPDDCAIIYGDADEVVDPRQIAGWVAKQAPSCTVQVLSGAGHFFHGRLNDVKAWVGELVAN